MLQNFLKCVFSRYSVCNFDCFYMVSESMIICFAALCINFNLSFVFIAFVYFAF